MHSPTMIVWSLRDFKEFLWSPACQDMLHHDGQEKQALLDSMLGGLTEISRSITSYVVVQQPSFRTERLTSGGGVQNWD
jgi:hypothetical protein